MPIIPITELKRDLEIKANLMGQNLIFKTTWGLFSPEKIDEGTEILLKKTEIKDGQKVLDLGCGHGPIGIRIAKTNPNSTITMIDKDFVAVDYAKKNAELNGAKNTITYLSNGFDQIPKDQKFDVIISNLPAKISKEFFWILFAESYERLNRGGILYVVTIAGLQRFIQKNFEKIFGNYELLDSKKTYFVAKTIKAT